MWATDYAMGFIILAAVISLMAGMVIEAATNLIFSIIDRRKQRGWALKQFTFDYVREDADILIQQIRACGCRRVALTLTDTPNPIGVECNLIEQRKPEDER